MNHLRTPLALPAAWADDYAAHQRTLLQWWDRLPTGLRSPIWPAMLGGLMILSLLLAFHQVVQGAVEQGELRHKATAVHAEATWRCNILPGLGASDNCLSQLRAMVDAGGLLTAQGTRLAHL